MTSPPRTLAILLLACALAGTASAAPTGSFEESASAASDEISSRISELSETLRSSITPELRSALVERFAPGRPEPHVRGRSLAMENICTWEQGDEDYDYAMVCNLKPSVVNSFKAATPEGRTGFEALKPIVTCLDIKLEDECKMKPSCIWYTEDGGFCDGDFGSLLTTPVPASSCTEAEKVDVTIMSLLTRELVACMKFQTESTCNNAKGLSCGWSSNECGLASIDLIVSLITGASKELHTVVALGRQADTCAAKTSSGDCAGVSGCSWNSGTSLCDVADATVKSIVGVETLAGVFSTWNTCQKLGTSSSCTTDANCKWVAPNCEITSKKAGEMFVDGMAASAFKTFISDGTYCTNSRASDGTTGTSSSNACVGSPLTREDGTTLPGTCFISDQFKVTVAGQSECFFYSPASFTTMLNEAYPGYDKRCPNVNEQFLAQYAKCEEANSKKAECGAGDYSNCKWSASATCEYDSANIWKLILGEEDGVNLISIGDSCSAQKSESACGAHQRDIDFFGLKYPDKSKVSTTLGFKGITSMDKTKAETLQKAVADAVGGDVKAEEIAIKGVQFPVESKIELSTSKSAVDADRAGFETKFKTGLALDLGVLPSDIVVKDIKEASRRRRRGLLASGVAIDYEVDGAPDGVRAQAIAKEVTSTGGLATLKSETGAEATVPAGTTPTYELRVEVEPATSDPNGVAAKLNAATITVDGVTAEHETQASVEENTPVPVSAANTYGHSVIAVLAAVAGVLILA